MARGKGGIDGLALGAIATGTLLAYAGLKGKSVLSTVQSVISGKPPSSAESANTIVQVTQTGNTAPASEQIVASGSAQQILQQTAAQFGWGTGPEWQALQNIEMAEAGFDPTIVNQSSGAYGLAQALGHGTAGTACPQTGRNEYGGYGLTDAQAQAANCGQPGPQALWMCTYIKDTYGDPVAAWAHEQANHWYVRGTAAAAPGWAIVGEQGPELVRFSGGEQVIPDQNPRDRS